VYVPLLYGLQGPSESEPDVELSASIPSYSPVLTSLFAST